MDIDQIECVHYDLAMASPARLPYNWNLCLNELSSVDCIVLLEVLNL